MAASLPTMTEKQRLLISVAVVVLGSVGLGTVWGFGFRQERELDAQSESLERQLKQAQADLALQDELEKRHRESLDLADSLAAQLPAEEDREGVFEILQQAKLQAGEAGGGVEFAIHEGKTVEPKAAQKKLQVSTCEERTLGLVVAGTWSGFVSFLDGIEHADRLIGVKSFKTDSPAKEDPLTYQYHLTLSYYWLKGPAAGGAP